MAKIKTIKLEVKDQQFNINVNCSSAGVFTANIPRTISDTLGIKSRLELSTLGELEKEIYEAFHRYRDSTTTEELYIFIKYGAKGKFNQKADGYPLFGRDLQDKFAVDGSFVRHDNLLAFDYKVCMKRTVDGNVSWYETNFGYKGFQAEEGEQKQYRKSTTMWSVDSYVKIPYSQESIDTLDKIHEAIRVASETLFNFVSLEETDLQAFLETGNISLLN